MDNQYSVSDLKERAQLIVNEARSTKKPACITQNGSAVAFLVDADTYLTQMQALNEFRRIFDKESSIRPADADEQPDSAAKHVWRCMMCGFTVEADELPEDFVCPLCGAGRDEFERIDA